MLFAFCHIVVGKLSQVVLKKKKVLRVRGDWFINVISFLDATYKTLFALYDIIRYRDPFVANGINYFHYKYHFWAQLLIFISKPNDLVQHRGPSVLQLSASVTVALIGAQL